MTCRPFISYAKEDASVAERLYGDLIGLGAAPWLDTHELRGGEAWRQAIHNALRQSTHVLTLISASSVSKTGFVQAEVRRALELLDTMPPNRVFIVPIRLDASTPQHEKLNDLHWIDLFPDYSQGLRKVVVSLNLNSSGNPQKKRSRWLVSNIIAGSAVLLMSLAIGAGYLSRQPAEPEVITDSRLLYPDGQRGSEAAIGVTIPAHASVLLTFAAPPQEPFPAYRVALVDLSVTPARTIWTRRGVQVSGDGLFAITIPNAYLNDGVYQLRLVGLKGDFATLIGSYTIRAGRR